MDEAALSVPVGSGDCVRKNDSVSTTVEATLITVLVFGIVAALFGLIYVWEKWGKGSRLEQRMDGLFDRLSDMFDR
jgi:hypothetical protein